MRMTGAWLVGIAVATLTLAGCGTNTPKASSGRLVASDFVASTDERAAAESRVAAEANGASSENGANVTAAPPRVNAAETLDVAAMVGSPSVGALSSNPGPANGGLVLDSLVGQINGNPVYASKFFRDTKLDAALAGMVVKLKNDTAWKAEARKSIEQSLYDKVRDELVLAEARSSLTAEERKGLLFFLGQLRNQLISGGGGSEASVDESLREREGINIDEKVKQDLETQLVRREIMQRIASKIIVSWKDVQLEYERRYDEFHPPPIAQFRMIWLPADKPELIEEFKTALASGTDFKMLAAREQNQFNSGEAGFSGVTLKGGSYADTEFFRQKELNDAARTLSPGATTGLVTFPRRVGWVHLEAVQPQPGKELYDVQLQLEREIKERRLNEESKKYLARLLNKGSYTDLKEMTDKLLAIASDRFLVTNRP